MLTMVKKPRYSRTTRDARNNVTGCSRYTTTSGNPAIADSTVTVPLAASPVPASC